MKTLPEKGSCVFFTNCVEADGDSINDMREKSTELNHDTFRKYLATGEYAKLLDMLGYPPRNRKDTFCLTGDWHVSYYRSVYQGKPCVYLVHSAIEYVFTTNKK